MSKRVKILLIGILTALCVACVFATSPSKSSSTEEQQIVNDKDTITYCSPLKDRKEQLLYRLAYTVSYNLDNKIPNWVAWKETKQYANGKLKRTSSNAFREDEQVRKPRASLEDYKHSGWSRGHMYPAGDAKWSKTAMYESFLLTNICPQDQKLNAGDWEEIESLCRQWAKRYGEIYIVCGPILDKNFSTIGKNKVAVPKAFFKVVLSMNPEPKAIGFICENAPNNFEIQDYVLSVDEVERIIGIDFFPFLEDSIENKVEAQSNLKLWLRKGNKIK